ASCFPAPDTGSGRSLCHGGDDYGYDCDSDYDSDCDSDADCDSDCDSDSDSDCASSSDCVCDCVCVCGSDGGANPTRKVAKIYLQTFARLSESKVQKRPRRRARILFANVFSAKQRPPRWGCQTTACNVNLLPADRTFLPGNGCHRAKNAEARPAGACRAREKTSYSPPTGL